AAFSQLGAASAGTGFPGCALPASVLRGTHGAEEAAGFAGGRIGAVSAGAATGATTTGVAGAGALNPTTVVGGAGGAPCSCWLLSSLSVVAVPGLVAVAAAAGA